MQASTLSALPEHGAGVDVGEEVGVDVGEEVDAGVGEGPVSAAADSALAAPSATMLAASAMPERRESSSLIGWDLLHLCSRSDDLILEVPATQCLSRCRAAGHESLRVSAAHR